MTTGITPKSPPIGLIDDEALGNYLLKTRQVPGLQIPIKTTKIGYGQSNPTFFVDDASGTRYIMRKKPPGQIISAVAHQIDREFRVLRALGSVPGFPVPAVYCLCEDTSVLGTSFYLMEFVKGRIITDPIMADLSPADRRKAWFSAIETLAWLHSLNPDELGLESFGKKSGFYARHCNTWSRIEKEQAKVVDQRSGKPLGRAHEKYDEVLNFVREHLPVERYSIMHGDFKFDNLILHPTEPRVIAILDWELSTIGNPLNDVVFLLSPFFEDHIGVGKTITKDFPYKVSNRKESGMPEPEALLERYAEITGFHPTKSRNGKDWESAIIFHYARGATISHGIQARSINGQASSDFSHLYFGRTRKALDAALERIKSFKQREDKERKAKL